MLGGLKARNDVRMNHFKVKMTQVYYVFDSRNYQGISKFLLAF